MKRTSFEQFCKGMGHRLTSQQKQIYECWRDNKTMVFVGRRAGLTVLMKLMNEYEQAIEEVEMASKKKAMTKLPAKLNGNTLAKYLTDNEGGKVSLTIAQAKEALKVIGVATAQDPVGVLNVLNAIGKRNA